MMEFTEYLAVNVAPAKKVKEACAECDMAVVIHNGVIIDIVKENKNGG